MAESKLILPVFGMTCAPPCVAHVERKWRGVEDGRGKENGRATGWVGMRDER